MKSKRGSIPWFLARVMTAATPEKVLESYRTYMTSSYPNTYGQLWVADSTYDLLLVLEWGNTSATRITPDYYRLELGAGIVGEAFVAKAPKTRDMRRPEDFALAAAKEMVRAEGLVLIAARPLFPD